MCAMCPSLPERGLACQPCCCCALGMRILNGYGRARKVCAGLPPPHTHPAPFHRPALQVMIVSTRAGSLGINLTSARHLVLLDVPWNPVHNAQVRPMGAARGVGGWWWWGGGGLPAFMLQTAAAGKLSSQLSWPCMVVAGVLAPTSALQRCTLALRAAAGHRARAPLWPVPPRLHLPPAVRRQP